MTPKLPVDDPTPAGKSMSAGTNSDTTTSRRNVIQGAVICAAGILVGSISLVLCCYSFGANFRGEGWGEQAAQPISPQRISLIASLIGFGVAIPLFWVGFFRVTHSDLHSPEK